MSTLETEKLLGRFDDKQKEMLRFARWLNEQGLIGEFGCSAKAVSVAPTIQPLPDPTIKKDLPEELLEKDSQKLKEILARLESLRSRVKNALSADEKVTKSKTYRNTSSGEEYLMRLYHGEHRPEEYYQLMIEAIIDSHSPRQGEVTLSYSPIGAKGEETKRLLTDIIIIGRDGSLETILQGPKEKQITANKRPANIKNDLSQQEQFLLKTIEVAIEPYLKSLDQ